MAANSLDLIIEGGTIYDGTGSPWFRADIGIRNGQIVHVGLLGQAGASESIDARGLAVTPGFFDVHTHSEFSLLANPFPKSQLLQGVTSEVEGHCGYSAFPLVEASHGFLFEPEGMTVDWSTAREYFDRLVSAQPGMNTAVCVGHTVIRAAAAGREDRKVTGDELEQMKSYIREALEAGAIGLSTGLDYPPGGSADTEELIELCKVVAAYGGVYTSHVRGHTDNFVNAVAEAIQIGRQAEVPVQVSHFGAAGPGNLERTRQALDLVDEAREEGVDVMIDIIPYGTAGSWWAPRAIFPEWAYDWRINNLDHVRELLLDPDTRSRLRSEVEERRVMEKHGFEEEMVMFSDWGRIVLAEVKPESVHADLVGKTLSEIAEILDKDSRDAYFDLLIQEYPVFSTVRFVVDEEALVEMLEKPYAMIGSDSVATSPEAAGESFNVLQPHPRNYGCFPHVLGNLVRERGIMPWEEAIRKMTSLPAQRFGFTRRGLVREGMQADLVVFDSDEIAPRSTWRQPGLLPKGIHHVLVNGKFAVRDAVATGVRAGTVVRWNV
jgi:N-acyl-D-aspartate/D-glutamate deacylase